MPESNNPPPSCSMPLALKITAVALVATAVVFYKLDPFDPASLPAEELSRAVEAVEECNGRMLQGAERVGVAELKAPEDFAYDSDLGLVYTGDSDGWLKRVRLNDSAVEKWAFTGGRPLGVALGHDGSVFVADADKGLLKVSKEGVVETLTTEAGGLKFQLTDGVDVADDGTVYFTDASSKYRLHNFIFDMLEGRPLGRLLRYDPTTKTTELLVGDLYFANGVVVAPSQDFVVFCETPLRRCRKYYIAGDRKGSIEKFVDNLPGTPDNIKYDGHGHFWIGLATEMTSFWYLALKYPVIRKIMAITRRHGWRPNLEKNGGAVAVNLEGKQVGWYYDYGLSMITTGLKIKNHLYCGSFVFPGILRLNLDRYPARTAGCPWSNSGDL
ncbi:protein STRICTOSIDINE SYNTHASE-LIKE 6-like [Cucurbita pepo subsp. pepo]|uniref:protein STRICTOSIDINE SYNTHASE-LIKE 6-like n=1 Tax=Cucurbita pepo subsp. pepo TaxID=3664 RepID=UPI000C9D72CC|nr:protein STRICTOSIDINE SYNTHASE-LIKE 6-like [Cucurbita pepo subsp. pepo]